MKNILSILIPAIILIAGCSGDVEIPDRGIKECPEGMANAGGRVCIDIYEFPNQAGEYPLVNVDWETASALCETRGKRLCTGGEWIFACGGGEGNAIPGKEDGDIRNLCNTSQKYLIPGNSRDKEGDEKTFEMPAADFLSDVKVDRAGVFMISPNDVSTEIIDIVQAIHLYLVIHEKIISAKEIVFDLSEKGFTFRKRGIQNDYLDTFLQKSNFLLPQITEIKKDVEAGGTQSDTKELLKRYRENLEASWKIENEIGRLFIRKNDTAEITEKFNKLSTLAIEHRKLTGKLFAASPDTVLDMARYNLEEAEKQLNEFVNKVYDDIIPALSYSDIDRMKDEVSPYFLQNGMERFPLYFYAIQRKLKFEYSSEDAKMILKKPDLEAGANTNCVTKQGVFDMVGNVWEWTGEDKENATYRGGDANEGSGIHFKQCNPMLKGVNLKPPDHKSPYIGFRCCIVPDEKKSAE